MRKWQKLNSVMDNCDAALILSPDNRRYLSGFSSTDGMVLVTKEKAYLITDFRYITAAKENPEGLETILMEKRWNDELLLLFERHNVKRLGIEEGYITLEKYNDFKEKFKEIETVPVSHILSSIRMIKSEDEIEKIKKAQAITDKTFAHILGFIKPGVTEADIAIEIDYFMKKNGAECPAFETIAVTGEKTAIPHGVPANKPVKNGDFLTMDFGAAYDGYCSDMTRTIAIGHADEDMKKIYNIVLGAQKNALDNIRTGLKGSQVDFFARSIIDESGYGQYFGHSTGHSVGLLIHEEPSFSPRYSGVIPENSVMTVEPGIYIEGRFGVRIEDMIIVKKDGIEDLTKSDKALIIL